MGIVVDTNTLILFFTNDIPSKADSVEKLFEEEKGIFIPDVVFPELEYILMGECKFTKDKVIKVFTFLIFQRNFHVSPEVRKAIKIFENTKLDMADCIIAASSLNGKLASFDKELLGVDGIKPFWN